jgi:CHAT domain-containing protein
MKRLAVTITALAAAALIIQPSRAELSPSPPTLRQTFEQQLTLLQDCRAKYAAALPSVPPYCYADVVISLLAQNPAILSDRLEKAFNAYVSTRPTMTADVAAQHQLLWQVGAGGRAIMQHLAETQALASSEIYAQRAVAARAQDGDPTLYSAEALKNGRGWPPLWLIDHINAQVGARKPFGWTTEREIDFSIRKKQSADADEVAAAGARYQRWQRQPATLAALLDALPPSTMYVEFIDYRSATEAPAGWSTRPRGEARYYAFTAWKQGHQLVVRGADVGSATVVDEEVLRFLRQIRELFPAEGLGRSLYQRLLGPFDSGVAAARQLVVAPSGLLSVLPFEALPTPRGYLNDGVAVLYGNARDVLAEKLTEKLRRAPSPAPLGRGLVLADPAYARKATAPSPAAPCAVSRGGPAQAWLFPRSFEALPCTSEEAAAIQRLSPGTIDVLSGAAAAERAVRRRERPRFLHLATHAFFLPPPAISPAAFGAGGAMTQEQLANAPAEVQPFVDPLASSALALAGANGYAEEPPQRPSDDDGLLSGSEVQDLNLVGTELVVMSACDTAKGVVGAGHAFYGLRHAFRVAGAAAVVASLWSANDVTTSWFMSSFYTHLFKGEPAAVALQRARLELRQKCDVCNHPYYWAPFVMEGSASAFSRKPVTSAAAAAVRPTSSAAAPNAHKRGPD